MSAQKAAIIAELQQEILSLQGFSSAQGLPVDVGLGPIAAAFPNGTFPTGAVHEFVATRPEAAAATSGFVSGLLSALMSKGGTALWIGTSRKLFPPALRCFGIQPDRFVFVDLEKEQQVIWAMDEALKCPALTAVVGEVSDISFIASRRLQLAVEQSKVTGFVLRNDRRVMSSKEYKQHPTACVSRWKITPLPSSSIEALPGVGFPQWKVELLRIRNGKPGSWDVTWEAGRFRTAERLTVPDLLHQRKTG